ncbi:hypothetical protein QJS04_geneDACA023304 [Acorus gramineus]|uniref:Uncharacterized protein n=1 Tax=Acorus gramineus TaxID=55184 RepID=A0AAV9BA44_ACOGR|nr:hypothetical protein QJS04_geneDACA023304 [Acorus gramineus]
MLDHLRRKTVLVITNLSFSKEGFIRGTSSSDLFTSILLKFSKLHILTISSTSSSSPSTPNGQPNLLT